MYTLYYSPGTASMVVHLALLEIGAPYRLGLVDFAAGAQRDPKYLELNPHGTVPTLLIDGKPLTESAALLMILAERHPDAHLAPASGTAERDAWYQWIVYLSNTLAATYRFWFYPDDLGAPEHTAAMRKALQRKIEGAWDRLERTSVRAGSVHARRRVFRCRPAADHADALVAQDAASGDRMARARETGRSRARAPELEKTVSNSKD